MHRSVLPLAFAALIAAAGCGTEGTSAATSTAAPSPTTTAAPVATTTVAPAPAVSSGPVAAPERGTVLAATKALTIPRAEVQALLDQVQLPGLTEARYGLVWWDIEYWTTGLHGESTVASGSIVVPDGADGPLPVVSDQHGTQTADLPPGSPPMADELYLAGVLFASQGYLVVGADYLGLGASDVDVHPYYHAETEASATVDMLLATRGAADRIAVDLGDQLFLTGYSQGAHVTMALHRALESEDHGFTVTASATMAGAYDLDTVSVPLSLAEPAPSTPLYLTYALLGLNPVYGFADDVTELFVEPYAGMVEGLFDGTHGADEISAQLPADPAELLRPDVLAQLRSGDGPIAEALRQNNVYDWEPEAPVRVMHGGADRDVPFRNAEVAVTRMRELGADVELVDLGDEVDHATGSVPAYLAAKAWFDSIRATG